MGFRKGLGRKRLVPLEILKAIKLQLPPLQGCRVGLWLRELGRSRHPTAEFRIGNESTRKVIWEPSDLDHRCVKRGAAGHSYRLLLVGDPPLALRNLLSVLIANATYTLHFTHCLGPLQAPKAFLLPQCELLSKLLVSPLITPIVVPYIISYITPFKEFRL